MTEKYHCTPNEFYSQPDAVIELHREFMLIERDNNKLTANREAQKSRIAARNKIK